MNNGGRPLRIRVFMPLARDGARVDEDGFVEVPEGSTLGDLLRLLRVPFRRGAVLLTMVNYERSPLSRTLAEGDTVSFLSPVAGG